MPQKMVIFWCLEFGDRRLGNTVENTHSCESLVDTNDFSDFSKEEVNKRRVV